MFLQREVSNVIRNGRLLKILVMLLGGHTTNRFKRTRSTINVVRAILLREVSNEVSFSA